LQVWADGQACGHGRLEAAGTGITVGTAVDGATVREEGGFRVVEFEGVALICTEGEETECEAVSMWGSVAEQPNDDEPIWQFHAGGVHSAAFPARTHLGTPGWGDDELR
jgi:hypothetical protein